MHTTRLTTYGGPLRTLDVEQPTVRPGDALVRVKAAAVTAGDHRLWSGRFPAGFTLLARLGIGVTRPRMKTLGGAFSGVVAELGEKVSDLKIGDEVAGMVGSMGAHAEYVRVPADRLAAKPPNVTHEAAAGLLFGGVTALHFLVHQAAVQAGDKVLVNGASGAVGSSAVQLAVHLGAHVTAVFSAGNAALVRGLGADEVVDYRQNPAVNLAERFDVVVDAVGNISRQEGLGLLTSGGRLVLVVAGLGDTIRARGAVSAGVAPEKKELSEEVLRLGSLGVLDPLVEVVGGLGQVEEALRRIDTRRKVGNLVVVP